MPGVFAADDAPTSMGTSTPSDVASTGGSSTPRIAQQREEQAPRWSDVVEEDDEDESQALATGRRRRRRRGNRGRKAGNADSKEFDGPDDAEDVGLMVNQRDRASVTLADLGLLVSTPQNAAQQRDVDHHVPRAVGDCGETLVPISPSKALMGRRCIVGTSPTDTQSTFAARAVNEASFRNLSGIGAMSPPTHSAQLLATPGDRAGPNCHPSFPSHPVNTGLVSQMCQHVDPPLFNPHSPVSQQMRPAVNFGFQMHMVPPMPGQQPMHFMQAPGAASREHVLPMGCQQVVSADMSPAHNLQFQPVTPPPELLRSWLQAQVPVGVDVRAQLQAVAPEVYED